jgi:iron complex transport system ATP-binding protein
MLTLDALTVQIGGKVVCRDLSLNIAPGQRWAILGVNGVGKTTLLHTLAGLRAAASGNIGLGGQELDSLPSRQRALQIGLMSQDDEDDAESTVIEAALLGRLPHLHWWQGESANDEAIARRALAQVGLPSEFETRRAATLSGGERRRLALAALLVQDAPLLLLDEPTSHLDLHQQIALLDLLSSLTQRTLVMTLHDVNLAARYCSHVLMLFGDGDACGGPADSMLSPEILSRLYRHKVGVGETAAGRFYFPV